MNAQLQYSDPAALRVGFFTLLTTALRAGQAFSIVQRLHRKSARQIGRVVGLPKKAVEDHLRLHAMFDNGSGAERLAMHDDESVTIDPAILVEFLSKPAAIRLVSDISTMSETSIRFLINRT